MRKNHFYEIIPFDTHSTANLPPSTILEKGQVFFSKNQSTFRKKPQILNVLSILTIQVAFYGKFATIWSKMISRSVAWTNLPMWRERNWQTGKKSEIAHSRWRFCFHILNMAQNYKALFQSALDKFKILNERSKSNDYVTWVQRVRPIKFIVSK